jgi:ZIP family zinc transporter
VIAAIGWGALAASSLVIGALLGVLRPWPRRLVGLVLAFGAGALIRAVSFDLAEEGAQVGDAPVVALGLAVGAITYFALNRVVARRSRGRGDENAGSALALGAFLDGVPEQMVLDSVSGNLNAGIDGFAAGALLVMLIDSMIPEAVRKGGDISGLVTVLGFAVAAALSAVS